MGVSLSPALVGAKVSPGEASGGGVSGQAPPTSPGRRAGGSWSCSQCSQVGHHFMLSSLDTRSFTSASYIAT